MSIRRGNGEGTTPRQRSDGRWQIDLRYADEHGTAKRTAIYGRTAKEARDKARQTRQRIEQGRPARDRRVTIATFADEWIGSALAASDRKATTRSMYATIARKHIIDSTIGRASLDRIRARHIEAWLVELRGRNLSESTVRSAYTVLRSVLDTAVRDGALAANPAAAITRPKVTAKEAAFLDPDAVHRLLDAAQGSRYAPLLELLVNTGLRRGEALALQWSDVNFDDALLRVRGTLARVDGELVVTETKTAKSNRVVPLSEPARVLLRQIRTAQKGDRLRAGSQWIRTEFVFTTESGAPCDPRNALRALKAAAKRSGLPDIGLHTLRHSAASVMLANGVPLKVVSEVLGHSSVAVTGDVYGHVAPDVSREALAGLSDALANGGQKWRSGPPSEPTETTVVDIKTGSDLPL